MTSRDDVRTYYAGYGQNELARLTTPAGRLEMALTTALLAPHLPSTGTALDIGGGPGRYTQWLVEQGLRPTLADLSPELLAIARDHLDTAAVEEIVEADACDLSRWADHSFDVSLSLGPFYHLPRLDDRQQAVRELVRVTRPGGLVAVAMMPTYGYLRRTLTMPDERHRMADTTMVRDVVERGHFVNDTPGRFTEGFGVDPRDPQRLFEDEGIETVLVASTHGFATGLEDQVDTLRESDPDAYAATLDVLVDTATDPALFGTAGHLLLIGRTPR